MPSKVVDFVFPQRLGIPFRWLVSSSWVSNLGDGIALAAAPLLVASLTNSPLLIALAPVMQGLPWLLFGLHAGAIADRFDRKRLVMFANGIRALIISVLVVFIVTGAANIWIVLATSFLYGVAEVFADSASGTLMPMIVDKPDLGIANQRMQAGFLLGNQLLGAPIGAFLFAIGHAWPFVTQVVAMLFALLLIWRMQLSAAAARGNNDEPHEPLRRSIAQGLTYIWHTPSIRTLALVILVFNVTWAAPWGVLVFYSTDYLGMDAAGYGLLTAASATGGIVATLLFGWLDKRFSYSLLMRVCLTSEVLMHLMFALNTTRWGAYALMFFFGAYAFVWATVSNTLRQRIVPTELMGRVGAVMAVCVFGGLEIGWLLGGVIAELWGPTAPWWFAFIGSGITLVLIWPQLRHVTTDAA